MKVAVIGSGIAGLGAAWTLTNRHDVTVYEADQRAGGHANTVDVPSGDSTVPVDTGFIVFNEHNYPNLCRLFDALGVASHDSEMSFSVSCQRTGREWNGTSLNQVFAQRSNLLRPSHWAMLRDILRFNRKAPDELATLSDTVTVTRWLERNRYSAAFRDYYLLPLGASLWSCSASHFAQFPMRFVIEFLHHHRMLQVDNRPVWRTVTGGSREYVRRIADTLGDRLRLATPVVRVRRVGGRVDVHTADGAVERHDEVVMACHADQAMRLVDRPDDTERQLLACFPYQKNIAVLHSDTRALPRRERAWASWNFSIPADPVDEVHVTYNMNLLQKLDTDTTWCVSLNPGERLDPARIHARIEYDHPMFTPGRSAAQARHAEVVRRRGISYCGAYWGFGFHEDGLRSALAVCEALNAEPGSIAA